MKSAAWSSDGFLGTRRAQRRLILLLADEQYSRRHRVQGSGPSGCAVGYRVLEVSAPQHGAPQVGPVQVGTFQVGTAQPRAVQAGAVEVRAAKVGVVEVHLRRKGAAAEHRQDRLDVRRPGLHGWKGVQRGGRDILARPGWWPRRVFADVGAQNLGDSGPVRCGIAGDTLQRVDPAEPNVQVWAPELIDSPGEPLGDLPLTVELELPAGEPGAQTGAQEQDQRSGSLQEGGSDVVLCCDRLAGGRERVAGSEVWWERDQHRPGQ